MKMPAAVLFACCLAAGAPAQNSSVEFGQNRVQYHEFVWSFYESENFSTYFYLGGQDIGKFVIQSAEKEVTDIAKRLEYKLSDRVDILVYTNLPDFLQSNIGEGLELNNPGGMTRIVGNKMFVYFNGSHQDLRRQIRQGIGRIMINDMMYGGNIQEVLQNAVLLTLPPWFIDGLVSYLGEEWNVEMDNLLRDGIVSGRYRKFNKLTGMDARYAGHFIWHYIGEKYGRNAIPNLLYLTRINRSLESGFLFVLGKPVNQTVNEWYDFNAKRFAQEIAESSRTGPAGEKLMPVRLKKHKSYLQPKISPDGSKLAYLSNEAGRYKVHLRSLEDGKTSVIFRGGFRTMSLPVDYTKPLIAWRPDGNRLSVIYEKRDRIRLLHYDPESGTKARHPVTIFQEVVSFSYTDTGNIVLSAVNRGQSDIYLYNLASTTSRQITNDFYDDLAPSYVKVKSYRTPFNDTGEKEGIVFSSNRQDATLQSLRFDTILPVKNTDIFFYDMTASPPQLIAVTQSPHVNESQALEYNSDHITFLGHGNGISNRHAAFFDITFSHYDTLVYFTKIVTGKEDSMLMGKKITLDSMQRRKDITITNIRYIDIYKDIAVSYPVSDYSSGILSHDISPAGKGVELMLHEGRNRFYTFDIMDDPRSSEKPRPVPTKYWKRFLAGDFNEEALKNKLPAGAPEDTSDDGKIDIRDYYFQTEHKKESVFARQQSAKTDSAAKKEAVLRLSRIRPYRVKLSSEYVVSQLDNSIIFTGYEPFSGNGGIFQSPDLNALVNLSVSDLFEDYRFVGGFRLPTDFKGSEYFFTFDDKKDQLDRKFLYYRKNGFSTFEHPAWFQVISSKVKTNYWQASLKWPIDIPSILSEHMAYRNDRIIFLSTDAFSLELPDYEENWGQLKLEYVFDNAIPIMTNIYNGSRMKVFYEYHRQLNVPKTSFSVAGIDLRHYERIHRQVTLASRLATSTSFGTRKIVYFLGGVDNWFFPKFNNDFPVDPAADYAFQALATNMRGFYQNIRHGNSYALVNTELRIPVFSYLINTPIKSGFFRNFCVNLFGDVGTAWEGISPYSKDNPLNTKIFEEENSPIKVKVHYFRNPVVAGYGIGGRSILFGYYVRADYSWGYEDGFRLKPLWHISLGMDF